MKLHAELADDVNKVINKFVSRTACHPSHNYEAYNFGLIVDLLNLYDLKYFSSEKIGFNKSKAWFLKSVLDMNGLLFWGLDCSHDQELENKFRIALDVCELHTSFKQSSKLLPL